MAYVIAWNEAAPVGASINASTLDTELQNLKKSVRERMNDILSNAWETDANNPKTIDVRTIAGTPRVAHIYANAAFTMATGVNQIIDFVGETFDTNSFHDNSTNPSRLTIPVTGYYRLWCNLELIAGAATNVVSVFEIRKNGSSTVAQATHFHPGNSTDQVVQIGVMVSATAADYYEVRLLQASGNTWTTRSTTGESFFEIEWINGAT